MNESQWRNVMAGPDEVRLDEVQGDMEVYGSDGVLLGPVGGLNTALEVTVGDTVGPDVEEQTIRYLKVDRTHLLSLSTARDLWVPESAIKRAVLGEDVILKVTAEEAEELYSRKPNVL